MRRSGVPARDEEVIAMPRFGGDAFPAVKPEEMAFAMALFQGVASGQIASGLHDGSEESINCECGRVLRELSLQSSSNVDRGKGGAGKETTLDEAFAALWHHYAADGCRLALCARVLGFYYLAQKDGGRILGQWASDSPDDPENVVLHPALVEAVAVVPLTEYGDLSESLFFDTVEQIARNSV